MKRNFLLMLLMTLLPLAGWADNDPVIVSGEGAVEYAVIDDDGLVASDLAVKIESTTYGGKTIYDENGQEVVTPITAYGNYFLKVDGIEDKLFPFKAAQYVVAGTDFEIIKDQASWDASAANGGLKYYLQRNPSEDRWNLSEGRVALEMDKVDGEWTDNCPHSWLGAVYAAGAQYPWLVLNCGADDARVKAIVTLSAKIGNDTQTWTVDNYFTNSRPGNLMSIPKEFAAAQQDLLGASQQMFPSFALARVGAEWGMIANQNELEQDPTKKPVTKEDITVEEYNSLPDEVRAYYVQNSNGYKALLSGATPEYKDGNAASNPQGQTYSVLFEEPSYINISVLVMPATAASVEPVDWAMAQKDGTYKATPWEPTITVYGTTDKSIVVPEYDESDYSCETGQLLPGAVPNYVVKYFKSGVKDEVTGEWTLDDKVDAMLHAGTYYVQVYKRTLLQIQNNNNPVQNEPVYAFETPVGEPKTFTVKQAQLLMRLATIYPYFHQQGLKAQYVIEGYKKVSTTDAYSFDNEDNTKIVNGTLVDLRQDGWWRADDLDWDALGEFDVKQIDKFSMANDTYPYAIIGGKDAHAFVLDGDMVYEDYKLEIVTPANAELSTNKLTVEIPEVVGKTYGDKDDFSQVIVTDQDDLVMDENGVQMTPAIEDNPETTDVDESKPAVYDTDVDVKVIVSREKRENDADAKYEDAGIYDLYVDVIGTDAVNYEVDNYGDEYDEVKEIDGGFRYIWKDRFVIDQYDITESGNNQIAKVIIEIDDVTYNGKYQQVKPKAVKFLDLEDVLAPVDGKKVTTNEYVAGTDAVVDNPETTDVDETAPEQPAYVLLTEDIKAADAVEAKNAVYSFRSYGDAEGTNYYAEGTVEVTALTADKKGATIKVKENSVEGFAGNEYNIDATDPTDNTKLRQLFSTEGLAQPIWVTIEKVSDAVEAADAVEAQAGDWTLAFVNPETGKGTQRSNSNKTGKKYTYYYNRYVYRESNGTVGKNYGECQIMAVEDNTETTEVEGSINFTGRKFGNFTVKERDLHIKVVGTAVFGSDPTYTLKQFGNTIDEGFVADEGKMNAMDTWITDNVTLNFTDPTVVVTLPTDYDGSVKEEPYQITAELKAGVNRNNVALNYNPIFEGSTLTVSPLELVFTALDQEVDYAEAVLAGGEYLLPDETSKTWTNFATKPVKLDVDDNNVVSVTGGTLPTGYAVSDFVTLSCNVTAVGEHAGALKLTKNTNASENITFTTADGKLTVKPLTEIRLAYKNVSQALEDHKGYGGTDAEPMEVFLPKRRLNTDRWYGMVLPFDVYVPELSNKIGYASVALLKETTSGNDVHFDTKVTIVPANTPFLLKVAPATLNGGGSVDAMTISKENLALTSFSKVKIGNAKYNGTPDQDPSAQTHDGGPKFIGSYKTGEKLEGYEYYVAKDNFTDQEAFLSYTDGKFYKGKNTPNHKMLTTDAYLWFPTEVAAREAQIFIDDEDGTVTAIEGIGAEPADIVNSAKSAAEGIYNVAGQRVNKAQKGIYIQDGKKVLVK